MTAEVFEVKVETHDGGIHVLRRFAAREEAEDHPVKLSQWKRVWIERAEPKKTIADAPLPWTIKTEGRWTYLIDGNGKRMASLYGSKERLDAIEKILIERCSC